MIDKEFDGKLDEILLELRQIKGAFPTREDGTVDIEGHRNYHDRLIKSAEAQEQFWIQLKLDLAKKGITSILIIGIGLLVTGIGMVVKDWLSGLGH